MRHYVGLVFDEVVTTSDPYYTSTRLNELLAVADEMALQVIVDDVRCGESETVRIDVAIETSANGTHWATKSDSPEVQAFTVYPRATTCSPHSYDTSDLPTLKFARLRVTASSSLTSSTARAHVQVHVTLRDRGTEPKKHHPPATPSIS